MAALPFFILPCRALCSAGMPAPAAVRGGAVAVVADSVGEPPVGRSVTLGEVVVGGSTGATGVQMRLRRSTPSVPTAVTLKTTSAARSCRACRACPA